MTKTRNIITASLAGLLLGAAQQSMALSLLDSSKYAAIDADADGNITIAGVTFQAFGVGNVASTFTTSGRAGFSGLGIAGLTAGEIDVGETARVSWTDDVPVTDFSVALLYNGPEFNDWAEIAKVTAYRGGVQVAYATLSVDGTGGPGNETNAAWSFAGGVVTNLSAATQAISLVSPLLGGGAWRVTNPFGNMAIDRLDFTAKASIICPPGQTCTNQSDYVLSSVGVVPEPQTYALLLAGLGAIGFMAKRRRLQN